MYTVNQNFLKKMDIGNRNYNFYCCKSKKSRKTEALQHFVATQGINPFYESIKNVTPVVRCGSWSPC